MKKLLSILAAVGLTATSSAAVVSCADTNTTNPHLDFPKPQTVFDNSDVVLKDATINNDDTMVIVNLSKKPVINVSTGDVTFSSLDSLSGKMTYNWAKNVKTVDSGKGWQLEISLAKPAYRREKMNVNVDGFKNKDIPVDTENGINSYQLTGAEYTVDASDVKSQYWPWDSEGNQYYVTADIDVNGIGTSIAEGTDLSDDLYITSGGIAYVYFDSAIYKGDNKVSVRFVIVKQGYSQADCYGELSLTGKGLLSGTSNIEFSSNYGEFNCGRSSIHNVTFESSSTVTFESSLDYPNGGSEQYVEWKEWTGDSNTNFSSAGYITGVKQIGYKKYRATLSTPMEQGKWLVISDSYYSYAVSVSKQYNGPTGWVGSDD